MYSVEGLQAAFEQIDTRVRGLIQQGKADSDLGKCVQKAWGDMFHDSLSGPALRGMVSHYRGVHGRGKTRKAGRGQRGGMAPLDYTMGQGTTASVYGRFPVEISSPQPLAALDMTRFFESPIGRSCDATGGFPAPTQKGGRRVGQHGGGFLDSLFVPHMPASVPRNVVEMSVSTIQGAPISNPPASPVAAHVPLMQSSPPIYGANAIQPISSIAPLASY
jgi:hypothetical protein